jgi:hypothetical protein
MTSKWFTRFGLLFIAPNIVFGAVALATPPATLIAVFNGAVAALASGVCVAYFPVIRNTLLVTSRRIDRADLLALGIFCSWFGLVLRTAWSLLWRYNGQPDSWTDTHLTSYFIFLSTCGAAFHLLAPGAVGDRVPTVQWIKIGALSAAGILVMMFAGWVLNLFPA